MAHIRKIPRLLKKTWPYFFLVLLTTLIVFLNYQPGTYLIGWDNLQSELSPTTNLKRALFSVWEEHQSLGLLGGMAHGSDLPRILSINVLSLFNFPNSLIRYLFIFLPLYLGPIGVYLFLYNKLFKDKLSTQTSQYAAFLGALFYLLNLATVQTFFTPFESFVYFYGSLPWLIYLITNYLENPNRKNFLSLFFASFLSSPGFYIETLFVVFTLCLLPLLISFFFQAKHKLKSLLTITKCLVAAITPQLFWLLPIILFVFTNGHVGEQAKINLISTPETYYRNLSFGNLLDILSLRGYFMAFVDLAGEGKFDYLMGVWRSHTATPIIIVTTTIISTMILAGIYYINKKRFSWFLGLMGMLAICIFFLVGGGLLINQSIPLVGELFRSPFTKFSTPLSFVYACLFSIGAVFLLDIFTILHNRLTYIITLFSVTFLLIINNSPIFSGNLISSKMRLALPEEYFQLFDYMGKQDPNTRVANFPQNNFWGWLYYDWGYRGSGFLWYGLRQPLLDRAFDVWEKGSEKYYEEVSSAIFSENKQQFEDLIDKYTIKWIIVDKHVIPPDGKTELGNQALFKFLDNSPRFTLEKNFSDQIFLYQVNSNPNLSLVHNFLSLSSPQSLLYPFKSPSLRPNSDWINTGEFLNLVSPTNQQSKQVNIPSLSETEKLLPVQISYQKIGDNLSIQLEPITPSIFVDKEQKDLPVEATHINIPINPDAKNFILQINQEYFPFDIPAELSNLTDYFPLTTLYLPSQDEFPIALFNNSEASSSSLTNLLAQQTPTQCYTAKPNRKIEKITTTTSISLLGTDVVACLSIPIPPTDPRTLLSLSFNYSSATFTTGNANISDADLNSLNTPQPLEPSDKPKFARFFADSKDTNQQVNLILEAEGSKSVQEITYSDIILSTHLLLFSTTTTLEPISSLTIDIDKDLEQLQVSLPITSTSLDIAQSAQYNSLFPEPRNCDQFNSGKVDKQITDRGILYQSQNAIECDILNLRHLPHSLHYLISFDYEHQTGLPLTICLENHSTKRCDIFERLQKTQSIQSLLQPIANPNETPGYTLHLFNQSIGQRPTTNLLKSLTIHPVPLNFLKNISLVSNNSVGARDDSPDSPSLRGIPTLGRMTRQSMQINSSSHPYEFLYTTSVTQNISVIPDSDPESIQRTPLNLNLYQTKSPYWKAIVVSPNDLKLPPWLLTIKIFLTYPFSTKLDHQDADLWHNSWSFQNCDLTSDDCSLVIVYLPQILEFIGFTPLLLIILFVIASPVRQLADQDVAIHKNKTSQKLK